MNNNICPHDDDCIFKSIEIGLPEYEIFMCECGVLIDYRNPINYNSPTHPMTVDDVKQLIKDLNEDRT